MPFVQTMEVKAVGTSNVLWMPADWKIEKGDLMHIVCVLGGQTLHHTTCAKHNSSRYLIIPKWWPCGPGDLIDVKISYAGVQRPEPSPRPVKERAGEEDHPSEEVHDA